MAKFYKCHRIKKRMYILDKEVIFYCDFYDYVSSKEFGWVGSW